MILANGNPHEDTSFSHRNRLALRESAASRLYGLQDRMCTASAL